MLCLTLGCFPSEKTVLYLVRVISLGLGKLSLPSGSESEEKEVLFGRFSPSPPQMLLLGQISESELWKSLLSSAREMVLKIELI